MKQRQEQSLLKHRAHVKTSLEWFNSRTLIPSQIPKCEIVNIRMKMINAVKQIQKKRVLLDAGSTMFTITPSLANKFTKGLMLN